MESGSNSGRNYTGLKDESSSGVSTSVQRLFSLKTLYKYTIGSCIPSKYSRDKTQNVEQELEEPAAVTPDFAQIMDNSHGGKELKKRINYHFQNHLQKWERKKFPWKALSHLLLVLLVTIQVIKCKTKAR